MLKKRARIPYQTNGACFQLCPLYLKTENSDISRHKHHSFLQFLHNKSKLNFNPQLIIIIEYKISSEK